MSEGSAIWAVLREDDNLDLLGRKISKRDLVEQAQPVIARLATAIFDSDQGS